MLPMNLMDSPLAVLAVSFVVLFVTVQAGDPLRNKLRPLLEEERHDFGVALGAALTLLGLLIGFSFSMALNRYDQRKDYEGAEANAIDTEFLRADLLPAGPAARLRELLKKYIDERVLFYTVRDQHRIPETEAETARLQGELWASVQSVAVANPTPVIALAVSGMNDVLSAQSNTQAAWWNRIPIAAWGAHVGDSRVLQLPERLRCASDVAGYIPDFACDGIHRLLPDFRD
jgi:hypothetical protein